MPNANAYIFDRMIAHAAMVARYTAEEAKEIAAALKFPKARIAAELKAGADAMTAGKKAAMKTALANISSLYSAAVKASTGEIEAAGASAAPTFAEQLKAIAQAAVPSFVSVDSPSPDQVLAAARNNPMTADGWIVADSFASFATDVGEKMAGMARAGFIMGETADQLASRMMGTQGFKFNDGEEANVRRRLERLARTTLQHYADAARQSVFERNADLIKGETWVATLDLRTCPVCGPMDGQTFEPGKGPRPPIHWMCRCTRIPALKSWKELGAKVPVKEWTPTTRASMDGQVPATVTWGQWIKAKDAEDPAAAKEALGAGRYELWKSGKWNPEKFDPSDRAYTLGELRQKLGLKPSRGAGRVLGLEIDMARAAAEAEKAAMVAAELKAEAAAAKAAADAVKAKELAGDHGISGAKAFGAGLSVTDKSVGGSTGARYYKDANGQGYYVKMYHGNVAQAQNEFVAAKLYERMGVRVPEVRMVEINGQVGVASRDLGKGYRLLSDAPLAKVQVSQFVKDGFVADAYLANWDVAGLSMDNMLVKMSANGKLSDGVRIDTGGSLLFRAQGGLKGSAFGAHVGEIQTLRDSYKNANTAKLFAKVTDADILKQIKNVTSISRDEIRAILKQSGMDRETAIMLDEKLDARKNDLLAQAIQIKKEAAAAAKAAKDAAKGAAAAAPGFGGVQESTWNGLPVRYGRPDGRRTYKIGELEAALKDTATTYDSLPSDQKLALVKYTGSYYGGINAKAVEGTPYLSLDAAIEKLPRADCLIFRGIKDYDHTTSLWTQQKKFINGEWAGVHFSAYSSCSFAENGFYTASPVKLVIENHGYQSGGLIEGRSSVNGEREYLVGRNAVYHVIGYAKENINRVESIVYHVREVPPDQIPQKQEPIKRWKYSDLMKHIQSQRIEGGKRATYYEYDGK